MSSSTTPIDLIAQIDLGQVPDSVSGQLVHLQASIPLILPKGAFQQPNQDQFFKSDMSWLTKWMRQAGFIRVDSDEEELLSKVKDSISCCCFTMPNFMLTDAVVKDEMKIYVIFMVESLLLDDLAETRNVFGTGSSGSSKSLEYSKMMLDILQGKYKWMSALPKTYPVLQPFLKGGFLFSEFANQVVPEFKNDCVHFARACSRSLEAIQLLQAEAALLNGDASTPKTNGSTEKDAPAIKGDESASPILWGVNEQTFEFLREFDSGALFVIELMAVLSGITVSDTLQDGMYFRRMMNLASSIGTHFNDLIGIRRDVASANESSNFNCILYRMKQHKQSLKESFEQTVRRVQTDVEEFKIICSKLRKLNENNRRLDRFINIVETYLDGTTYWSLQTVHRYDVQKSSIEEVFRQDGASNVIKDVPLESSLQKTLTIK